MSPSPQTSPTDSLIATDTCIEALMQGKDLGTLCGMTQKSADFIYAVGCAYFGRGDYKAAQEAFSFLCLHHHRDADAWLACSRTWKAQGDLRRALAALLVVSMLRPDVGVCLEMCRIYMALEETERAEECIVAARRLVDLGHGKSQASQVERMAAWVWNTSEKISVS